jgi:hypothetical protein
MPVSKCSNGKYRIGSGGCNFTSKAKAEEAYKAYLAKKHSSKNEVESIKKEIDVELESLELINKDLKKLRLKLGETDGLK